jgi:hypothetical protein
MNKPIGFDNWRTFFFVSKDGSNGKFWRKGSFVAREASQHKLYRGPSIAATNEAAAVTITTDEAHEFPVGKRVRISGMPDALAGLNAGSDPVNDNGEWVVLTVPTPTTFTVGFDSTGLGTTTGIGVVGVFVGDYIPADDYAMVTGRNCTDEYPAAWELPWEG